MSRIALLLLLLAGPAWACGFESEDHPLPEDSVVKIHSYVCGTANPFRGSGTILQHEGKAYVLTSDHVVMHGNEWKGEKICHTIWNPRIGPVEARYLASDWEMGLALLELPGVSGNGYLSFKELTCDGYPLSTDLMVMGYPADSEILMEDGKGRLVHRSRIPSTLYGVPYMGMINGTSAEFGMSGGMAAEVTLRGRRIPMGVLSHQLISYGRPGEVNPNLIFFIPITQARDWALSYLASPATFRPRFFQDIEIQTTGPSWAVTAGKLTFSTQCFGGAYRPCNVYVSYERDAAAIPYKEDERWMERLVALFETDKQLESIFVFGNRVGEIENRDIDANYAGLVDFLRRAAENPDLANYRRLGAKPERELPALHQKLGDWLKVNGKSAGELLNALQNVHFLTGRLERTGNDYRSWSYLNEKDFDLLLSDARFSASWKAMKSDEARKLRKLLEELKGVYRRYILTL